MNNFEYNLVKTNVLRILVVLLAIVLCLFPGCSTKNVGELHKPGLQNRVTQIMPASAKAGSSVVLTGYRFGTELADVIVRFCGQEAVVINVNETSIEVQVPLDAGSPLSVTIAGKDAIIAASFTYEPETLVVSSFTPLEGMPGTQVTISGEGFGTIVEWMDVSFGDIAAEVLSCTKSELCTVVPTGAVNGPITVRRGIQEVQSISVFSMTEPVEPDESPRVSSFVPAEVYPLDQVTITGANFGNNPEAVAVSIGAVTTEVVSVNNTQIVIIVPVCEVDSPIQVVAPAGTGLSVESLRVLGYPNFFTIVDSVDALEYGAGGIISAGISNAQGVGDNRLPMLGGVELSYLGQVDDTGTEKAVYRLPLDLDGEYYLGFPNQLAGTNDWVTAYYPEKLTVVAEGINPPEVSVLVPDEIGYQPDWADVQLEFGSADFQSPLALLVDGELAQYYNPALLSLGEIAAIDAAGALQFAPQNPLASEPGDHLLVAASSGGYSALADGYYVLPEFGLKITVDGISAEQAKIGDIVTLTGGNLFWSSDEQSNRFAPLQVWIGDKAMPVVPVEMFAGMVLNEMQFIITAEAHSGDVRVTFQHYHTGERGIPILEIDTGYHLEVDRHQLDAMEGHLLPKDVLWPPGQNYDGFTLRDSSLSLSKELWLTTMENVGLKEKHLRAATVVDSVLIDLGRIATAPVIWPNGTEQPGAVIDIIYPIVFLPDGTMHLHCITSDRGNYVLDELPVHYEHVLKVFDGTEEQEYSWLLYDSISGLGSEELQEPGFWVESKRTAYDELNTPWAISDGGLIKFDGEGWVDMGPGLPEVYHIHPEEGEVLMNHWGAINVDSSGTVKQFVKALPKLGSSQDIFATYLLTRTPEGVCSQEQVLGEMLFPQTVFDREGRGRIFTGDDEMIYIYREEEGFTQREWLAVPYPTGTGKPLSESMQDLSFNSRYLRVKYNADNQLVATLSMQVAPLWADALPKLLDYGAVFFTTLIFENGEGLGESHPVSVAIHNSMKDGLKASLDGIKIPFGRPKEMVLMPSGAGFMIHGDALEYSFNGTNHDTVNLGVTYYLAEVP